MKSEKVMTPQGQVQADSDAAWTWLRTMMGYGGEVEPISTNFIVPSMESLIELSKRYAKEDKERECWLCQQIEQMDENYEGISPAEELAKRRRNYVLTIMTDFCRLSSGSSPCGCRDLAE